MPGMKATAARCRPFQFQVVQLTHQNRPAQRWLLRMILDTPSKLHTARHIEVVASWRVSQLDASPLPGQVTGLLYFHLPTRDHAVMAKLHDSAFSGGVTISLARVRRDPTMTGKYPVTARKRRRARRRSP